MVEAVGIRRGASRSDNASRVKCFRFWKALYHLLRGFTGK